MTRYKTMSRISATLRITALCLGALIAFAHNGSISANQSSGDRLAAPILKGKEPAQVVGVVLAMSRGPTRIPYYSAEILLLRVDKVLSGKDPGHYVRVDLPDRSRFTDTEEARNYRELVKSLFDQKTWRIRLRAPSGVSECAWKIPAPPSPGEQDGFGVPIMLAVGGASGYPDINSEPCFVSEQADIEQELPPKEK